MLKIELYILLQINILISFKAFLTMCNHYYLGGIYSMCFSFTAPTYEARFISYFRHAMVVLTPGEFTNKALQTRF